MEQVLSALKNEKISLSLLTIIFILGWQVVGWAESQYMTKEAGEKIVVKLDNHIIDSTLYRIDRDIKDIRDKCWQLEEKMREDGGNTPERRRKLAEFEARVDELEKQRDCVHDNRSDIGVCFPGHR